MVFQSKKRCGLDYFLELGPNVLFDEAYRTVCSSSLTTPCQAHNGERAPACLQEDVLHPIILATWGIAIIAESEFRLFMENLIWRWAIFSDAYIAEGWDLIQNEDLIQSSL